MSFRIRLGRFVAAISLAVLPCRLSAQEHPVQRVANIVSVAVEEYGKGVDANGRLISNDEYQEALGFLTDARDVASRLPGAQAGVARALLDSIVAAMHAKKSPTVLASLNQRFSASLGREAALELPKNAISLAEGRRLYAANCASCHGDQGLGDGPAAAAIDPKPPAIGTSAVMSEVTPAMAFRKISVGVTGTAMPAFSPKLSPDDRWNIVMYLGSLRHTARQVAEGEGFYAQSCVSCHGVTGVGDGAVARSLSKLPPELGSFAWQIEHTDAQLAQAVSAGMPGTPMPPARALTPEQLASVVAYVRALPVRERTVAAQPAGADTGMAAAARASRSRVEP
jgi:mono/diheme cytochrome c family protein